jgi:hypothetical protein
VTGWTEKKKEMKSKNERAESRSALLRGTWLRLEHENRERVVDTRFILLEGAGITNGWRACDHVDSVQDA